MIGASMDLPSRNVAIGAGDDPRADDEGMAAAGGAATTNSAAADWRAQQRRLAALDQEQQRQRSLRTLMMFLMMLMLMEGDEPRQNVRPGHGNKRRGKKGMLRGVGQHGIGDDDDSTSADGPNGTSTGPRRRRGTLEPDVFAARIGQDSALQLVTLQHDRYKALIGKNLGWDAAGHVKEWSRWQSEQERDEFFPVAAAAEASGAVASGTSHGGGGGDGIAGAEPEATRTDEQGEAKRTVYHYPWNSTGFYRGTWTRYNETTPNRAEATWLKMIERTVADRSPSAGKNSTVLLIEDPSWVEPHVARMVSPTLSSAGKAAGGGGVRVAILPPHLQLPVRDDHNFTSLQFERMTTDSAGRVYPPHPASASAGAASATSTTTAAAVDPASSQQITLTRGDGRVAFQLYSRTIPGMNELSLVDGFVKLYDSVHAGYSTRKDLLLRVRGVHIHGIGRLSLVSSNVDVRRTALLIEPTAKTGGGSKDHRNDVKAMPTVKGESSGRRRLLEQLLQQAEPDADAIRAAALLDADAAAATLEEPTSVMESVERLDHQIIDEAFTTSSQTAAGRSPGQDARIEERSSTPSGADHLPAWSNHVIPYPFIRDDADESIRKERTPAYRKMPPREQVLEANAASCEFEISLDVQPVEWTVGAWRNLVLRRMKERRRLDPSQPIPAEDEPGAAATEAQLIPGPTALKERTAHLRSVVAGRRSKSKSKALLQDQALAMTLVGTIRSTNCDFAASLNATALRTDWDRTTSKAVNYSFYMMLVCLAQILVLLRQLLHSQSTSAATRVSLLTVGWQTVLDALLCLAHIYLSLAMQPLFIAFASVAFFKLLIFCVIEMKYMAMIIQARNSSNGGQTAEALRRQVAMLHLRFYVALLGTFIIAFYVGEKYRSAYALALYSFWVPQILYNVYTEAKTPLHKHYIYGMSVTRLVAPLYILAVPNNFLKEVYPDAPNDPLLCELLVLWVGLQVAILMAQGKYGARFMIPARFLPPKFDYSRPLPASMLPPGVLQSAPKPTAAEMMDDRRISSNKRDESAHGDKDSGVSSPAGSSSTLLGRHNATATTTRNRIRGKRSAAMTTLSSTGGSLIIETPPPAGPQRSTLAVAAASADHSPRSSLSSSSSESSPGHSGELCGAPALECCICYDSIDVHDRRRYMLAPCDHLFHRDCLLRWMDQKMECPTCRCQLPAV